MHSHSEAGANSAPPAPAIDSNADTGADSGADSGADPKTDPKTDAESASAPSPDADNASDNSADEAATGRSDLTSDALTALDPKYIIQKRIQALPIALIVLLVAAALEKFVSTIPLLADWPMGVFVVPAAVIAAILIYRLPRRRYAARGYCLSADRLRVVRGIWFRHDTVVPMGRVQHIDVGQGPIERLLGLATITLHTAGTYSATISQPGLTHDLALEMRDNVRAHIERESR